MNAQIIQFAAKCPTNGRPMLPTGGEALRGIPAKAVGAGLVEMVRFFSPTGDTRFGYIRKAGA